MSGYVCNLNARQVSELFAPSLPPSLPLSRLTLSLFPSPPLLVLSLSYEEEQEELWCNYERYRTLVQNAFRGISEEKCLKEIEIEDMYPETKKKPNKEKAKYECCHECDSSILPNLIVSCELWLSC